MVWNMLGVTPDPEPNPNPSLAKLQSGFNINEYCVVDGFGCGLRCATSPNPSIDMNIPSSIVATTLNIITNWLETVYVKQHLEQHIDY